jgi:hypothetical protein
MPLDFISREVRGFPGMGFATSGGLNREIFYD